MTNVHGYDLTEEVSESLWCYDNIITENGKEDEPLLGILTVWDIAGVADVNKELKGYDSE